MPLTSYMQKHVLDWVCGGAAPTQPAGRWISYATGTPTDSGASDLAVTGGVAASRMTLVMGAANSPQGSATLVSSQQNITAASAQTVRGWNMWDASAGGNRLAYGTMTAAFAVGTLSNIRMSSGSNGFLFRMT